MAVAGSLELQLYADVARLRKDMEEAKRMVGSAAQSMQRALDDVRGSLTGLFGGVSAAGFGVWIKSAIDFADELNDLNKTTSISIERLSGLALMSKQTGSDLTGIAQAMNKLTLEMGKAPEKFRAIGITAKDPLEAFKQMSEVFRGIEDPQLRAAVAAEALGKSWASAAPALSEGAKAIDEMVKRGEELAGITADDAKAADEFNDKVSELQTALMGSATVLSRDMLPLLTELVKSLTDVTQEANQTDGGFNVLTETMRALIVFGGNVAFVINGIAKEIGILAAQAAAVARGDFAQAAEIGRMAREDADKARASFDAWEQRMMSAGRTTKGLTEEQRELARETAKFGSAAKSASEAALRAFVDGDKTAKEAAAAAKAAATAYESLASRIRERIAVQQIEIELGRQLSEQEKFEAKVRADFAELLKKFPGLHQAEIDKLLEKAAAQSRVTSARAADLHNAGEEAKFWEKTERELADAEKARTDERNRVNQQLREQRDILQDSGELLKAEAGLVGATEQVRETALGQLRIELELKREIERINGNLLLGEQERAEAIRDATANAEVAKGQVAQRAALNEYQRIWNSIDQTAHDVFVNIFEGGSNVFKKLTQTLKATLLDALYQMTVRKWVLQFAANVTGSPVGAGMQMLSGGMGSLGGGFGGMGNIGAVLQNAVIPDGVLNGAATISNALGFGAGANAFGMGGISAGMSGAAEAVAMEATLVGGGTGAGALAGLGAAMPWLALGALAIGAFAKKRGGPKADGVYGRLDSTLGLGNRSSASDGAAATAAKALQAQYDTLVSGYGGSGGLQFGLGFSTDPKGTSPSFLDVTASRNGATAFSDLNLNIGRSEEELQAAMAEMGARAVVKGLQQSDIPGAMGDFFRSLTPDAMGLEDLNAAIERAKKALGEKQSIEEQIFLLTHTEQEILTRDRKAELEAIDETNRALGERVQILRDEKAAAATLSVVLQKAADDVAAFQSFVMDLNRDIRGYIDGLNSTPQGGGSLESQKNAAFEAFTRQLGLARSGDRNALQGITGYADQLISAQTAYTATSTPTQDIIALVKRELSSLPQMMSDAEYIAKAIADASAAQIAAGKTSVLDLGSLLSGKFATLDTSVNGLLDFAEVKAALGPIASDATIRAFMLQADLDADGQLSKLELLRTATSQAVLDLGTLLSGKFATLDTSLNGLLSFEELRAAVGPLASDATLRAFMLQADTDGDGQISRLEAIAAATGTLQTRVTDSITLVREALKGQSDLLFERFGVLDLSVDGLLTFDEVKLALGGVASDATLHAMIERIDANGDGQISKLEALNTSLLGGLFGSAGLIVDKFFDLDQDLSSLLDFSELKLAIGPLASDDTIRALIALVDSNGDQQISRQEATIAAIRETANATTPPPTTTTPPPTTATPPPTLPEGFESQLKTFIASGFAEMVGGGDSGPNLVVGPYSSFEQLTQSMSGSGLLSGLTPDQQTLALGEASALFNRYRTVGSFDVGTNRVPFDMLAMVHKDERIVPARDNPYANPYRADPKVDTSRMEALLARIEALTQRHVEVNAAGHRGARAQGEEIVQNTRAMSNAAKLAAAKPQAVGA